MRTPIFQFSLFQSPPRSTLTPSLAKGEFNKGCLCHYYKNKTESPDHNIEQSSKGCACVLGRVGTGMLKFNGL